MGGKIIILNGTSSSGKTSIARSLQEKWPSPLLYLGLDTAIGMLPFSYTGDGFRAKEGYRLEVSHFGEQPIVTYSIGPHARFLNSNLAAMADKFSSQGYDVVIDHVIADDATLVDLADQLHERCAFFVGVHCDIHVAAQRERLRGDRMIGLVEGQSQSVHAGLRPYDLVVDSSDTPSDDLADSILWFVECNAPKALKQISVDSQFGI